MTKPSDPVFDASNPHAMADDRELTDEQIAAVDFKIDEQEAYLLDAGCVRITDIEPRPCNNCGDEVVATKVVWLDMRNNGQNMGIGEFCAPCAEEFADRLRASLPEEKPE